MNLLNICNKYTEQQLQKNFIKNFGFIKVGLLIFFFIITTINQFTLLTTNKLEFEIEQTLINKFPAKIFLDALITTIFGIISFFFVWWSRGMNFEITSKLLLIIICLLFFFVITQEASGFNRFMEKSRIIKGTSIYNKITTLDISEYITYEKYGDPFVLSCAYFFFFILICICLFIIYKMLKYMVCAHKSLPKNHIKNIGVIFNTTKGNKYLLFSLELLIMIFLNTFPPVVISPVLREETNENRFGFSFVLILGIVLVLHLMLQFVGLL